MKKYTLTTVDQIVLGGLIGDKSKPLARHSPRSLYADLDYGTVTQIKSSLERLRGYGLAEYFVPLVSNDGKDWRVTEQGLKASMASTPVTPEEPVVLTSPEVRILKWLKEWAKKDDDWVSESQLADELCLTESVTLQALHSLVKQNLVDYTNGGVQVGSGIWRINEVGQSVIADRPEAPVATLGLGYTGDELETFTATGVDVKLENLGVGAELTVTLPDGTVWSFDMGETQSTFYLDWNVTRPKKKRAR